ncbi:MAG TPA: ribose-phosphate pyrophosphokinase, partial [Vicinamibacterales bacterium]|nr:ribose-phosphate pyrophosphokinase [Vicinamibacterales bacterium]
CPCARVDERFADGELHVEIEDTVRGHDVYVIQPTSPPVDEHLLELIFIADACRRAGAERLTAVMPYFGYARHDRRASGRSPVGARIAAGLLEHSGFARFVAIDLHAAAIEGFFQRPVEHLSAATLLADAVDTRNDGVIVAPDLGAMKLAERYHARLHLPIAVLHKARISASGVALRRIIGDVKARAPLIVDDMVTTGGTIEAAAQGLLDAGCAPEITVAATHGLFVGPAVARLNALPIRSIVTTDSVIPASTPGRCRTISLAPLLADVIARLHGNKSLGDLLAPR